MATDGDKTTSCQDPPPHIVHHTDYEVEQSQFHPLTLEMMYFLLLPCRILSLQSPLRHPHRHQNYVRYVEVLTNYEITN